MISKEERNIVKRMYNRIYSHKSIKDLTGNSLLITLFAMRDSNRYRVLRDNALLLSDAISSDSVKKLIKAGVKIIVQPGGSIKDPEVIKEANKGKIKMIFSGIRHFNH